MKKRFRKTRLVLFALIFALTASIIFFCSDWPSPTPEIAFRRAEKQQLIGPAEIITALDSENEYIESFILGKSDHGYTMFEYYSRRWDDGGLRFFPKTANATLFCPEYAYYDENHEPYVLIFLFPQKCTSPSAKLTLNISCDGESETYHAEGQRQDGGFYLLSLPYRDMKGKHFWLLQQALTGSYSEYVLTGTVDISIEHCDRNGQVADTYQRNVTK